MDMGEAVAQAARAAREGKAVVFPTDTVYGIGVSVAHARTPDLIYGIKRRDAGKAIPWLVGSMDDLMRYGRDVPSYASALARADPHRARFCGGASGVRRNGRDDRPAHAR